MFPGVKLERNTKQNFWRIWKAWTSKVRMFEPVCPILFQISSISFQNFSQLLRQWFTALLMVSFYNYSYPAHFYSNWKSRDLKSCLCSCSYLQLGSVYFDTLKYGGSPKFPQAVAMTDTVPLALESVSNDFHLEKKDRRDFALWKGCKPGEPYWETPWGRGRPGWHIQCSVMAR